MTQYHAQLKTDATYKAKYPDGSSASKDGGGNTPNGSFDFRPIAKALDREPKECRIKAKQLEFLKGVSSSAFSRAEDDKLRSCVENWGGNSRGRWSGLAKEMNRDAKVSRRG
jgi:hypothetical protein